MFKRLEQKSLPAVYRSSILEEVGIVHGFSTRPGGVSEGRYESLNFVSGDGEAEGDSREKVAENYRRLKAAVGARKFKVACVSQVHGREVVVVDGQPGCEIAVAGEGDALVTREHGVLLAIRTADCVPVLAATGDGLVVAAIHAGWRGLVAGVIGRGIGKMLEVAGVGDAGDVVAAVGPSIGVGKYEVGQEVAREFTDAGLGEAVDGSYGGKAHVDLKEAAVMELLKAGVRVERIDVSDLCTFENAQEFFSHRRDARVLGGTGRMVAVVGVGAVDC